MTMNRSHNIKLFSIISYFILLFEVINASLRSERFVHKAEDFDDRLLSLDAKWTHEVTSIINCVSICSLDEKCVSVQFHQAATICAGYVVSSASRPDAVSSPGYVMFDMDRSSQTFGSSCSDDSECTFTRHTSCVGGSCKCSASRIGDVCEGGDTTQTATTASGIQKTSLEQTQTTTAATSTTTTPTTTTATQTTTTATPTTDTATQTTTAATQTTTTATPKTDSANPTTAISTLKTTTASPTTAISTSTTATTTSTATTSAQTTTTAVKTTTVSVCAGCTVIPGITCTTDPDCIEPNAFCQGGNCVCPSGTTLVSRGTLYICEFAQPTCGAGSTCGGLANSACQGGVCTCSIGYHYNPVKNACDKMENCAEFLDTFTVYLGKFSFYSEDERRPASSKQECLNMCVSSTTITCKNFEVASPIVITCYLHQTTWLEFPKSVQSLGVAYNHYQRDCDWKAVTVGTGCRGNVDCSPLTNAECLAGKCACKNGTRLVPRVNKCLEFQEYGQACTADSDCYSLLEAFCLSGVCTCRHGYSYSPTGQYCRALKECTKFKDTFTTYPDSVILLHDIGSYGFSNPTKCKKSCINSPIFCKSAELSNLAICFTSDTTWQEATGNLASFDKVYTHFQRDCDWS